MNTEVDLGGASRAMQRSISALKSAGHDVILLTLGDGDRSEAHIVRVDHDWRGPVERRARVAHFFYNGRYVDRNRTELSDTLFWIPAVGRDVADVVEALDLDVLNIHWTSHFLSLPSLKQLMDLPVPVVFTLHDMAHLTGGCHYPAGCEAFQAECRPCPQLQFDPLAIPRDVRRSRGRIYAAGRPWAIAPSPWMADQARISGLFAPDHVVCVPNALDTEVFSPRSRERAREALGISPDAKIILAGAMDNRERRKGFDLLAEALERVVKRFDGPITVICLGANPTDLELPGLEVVKTGYIDDDERLIEAYGAADVTVIPSREDNLPNIMLESMSCGTPVAAFAVGGLGDTIQPGRNGALASPEDPEALATAILSALDRAGEMRPEARRSALALADPPHHASRYVEVFSAAREAAGLPGIQTGLDPARSHAPMATQSRPVNLEVFGGVAAEVIITLRAILAEIELGVRKVRRKLSWGRES